MLRPSHTERDMLRRFSHWSLFSFSLSLSLSQLLRQPGLSLSLSQLLRQPGVGTVLGHRPRRGRRASSSHRRGRTLSAPLADGHAHQLFPVLPSVYLSYCVLHCSTRGRNNGICHVSFCKILFCFVDRFILLENVLVKVSYSLSKGYTGASILQILPLFNFLIICINTD